MIDWGLSGVIIAIIAFVSNMITDAKVKKLTNKVAALEKSAEVINDDGGNDTTDV